METKPKRRIQASWFLCMLLSIIIFVSWVKVFSDDLPRVKNKPIYEVNFGADLNQEFMSYSELEIWARNHNLLVVPDASYRNLGDGLASIIKERGIVFRLYTPASGRNYLYLDLVTYRANGKSLFSKVRWLDIYGNGELLKTIYQGGGVFLQSPLQIIIDREHARNGFVDIELRPSPGDGFWAIWDAFISNSNKL